jgi:serine/threonine protein kinase
VREIGAGGMARVYAAHDERLDVTRAIKVLDPKLSASASLRVRFENEARTMAKLHHPNLVAVQDVGVEGDRAFIVMEMVEGGSLHDRVREHGPLSARLACELVAAVLSALDEAHRAGIVHRDVKPHNILLGRDGTPKITDFGIAHVPTDHDLTRTGAVMGTLAYMPPEQRQDAKSAAPSADLYSAGATLYALVTGKDPFDLYSREIQATAFAGLPGPLVEVLERACRYRPEERYASASEMRGALLAAAGRLPSIPSSGPSGGLQSAPVAFALSRETADTVSPSAFDGPIPAVPPPATPGDVRETLIPPAPSRPATRRGPPVVPIAAAVVLALVSVVTVALAASAFSHAPPTEESSLPTPAPVSARDLVSDPVSEPVPTIVAPATPVPVVPATPAAPTPVAVAPAHPTPRTPAPTPTPPEPPPAPVEPVSSEPVATAVVAPAPVAVRLFLNTRPTAGRVVVNGADPVSTPYDHQVPPGEYRVVLTRADGTGAPLARTFVLEAGHDQRFCWDWNAEAPCAR